MLRFAFTEEARQKRGRGDQQPRRNTCHVQKEKNRPTRFLKVNLSLVNKITGPDHSLILEKVRVTRFLYANEAHIP